MRRDLRWPDLPAGAAPPDVRLTRRGKGAPTQATWVDLISPSRAELDALGEEFGLDPLLVEALSRPARRPGFATHGDLGLLVVYAATPHALGPAAARRHRAPLPVPVRRPHSVDVGLPWLITRRFRADQVQLAVRDDLMITVRVGPVADLDSAWERWSRKCVEAPPHCGTPTYYVLDTIVDTYMPILDSIIDDVAEVEKRLLDGNIDRGRAVDLQGLFRCKRDLAQFGRVVGPQRAAVTALWRLAQDLVHPDSPSYFQNVADHLTRLAQNVDNYHDMLESTLNAYLVLVGNAKNDIMKRLTSVTILAGIPAFLTAWYGSNLAAPEFEWEYGYPIAVLLNLVLLAGTHILLRRRGFI